VNPPHVNAFFDSQHDRISQLANEMNVPPNYLLGLSAYESGWGQKNNLFGLSVNEIPNKYPSFDDSANAFRNSQWYSRLSNKGDVDSFVGELMKPPAYNSKNPDYDETIRSVIGTVNKRQPIWEQSQ
jgi:uncharacterized FlgJ-related protein